MRFALLAVAALLLAACPASAFRYRPTHAVSVTGNFVNHWTVDNPDECFPVGSGTLSVSFASRAAYRTMVTHDRANHGAWALLNIVDSFGHIGAMPPKPARGTVTKEDNTQPRPSADPGYGPCPPPDRTGCGASPLREAKFALNGLIDRRHITFHLGHDPWRDSPCGTGSSEQFFQPPYAVGGDRHGDIVLTMPSAAKLRRQKVVTIHGSTHKKTSGGMPGFEQYTDDVTRSVTVTFTRLR